MGRDRSNRLRVLAVDDSRFQRRIMARILQHLDAEVTWAEDGQQGLELGSEAWSRGQPFDAILMDMQMPVKDGYETVRELRESGVQTPIVAITSHSRERFDELGISSICNAYLQKPVSRGRLEQAFHVAVDERPLMEAHEHQDCWQDEDFVQLVRRYVGSLGELRSAVVHARETGDLALVRRLSHQVKGNAASCQLNDLSEAAAEVEASLDHGGSLSNESFDRFVSALDRTFARTL